jgi:hypothetical protein
MALTRSLFVLAIMIDLSVYAFSPADSLPRWKAASSSSPRTPAVVALVPSQVLRNRKTTSAFSKEPFTGSATNNREESHIPDAAVKNGRPSRRKKNSTGKQFRSGNIPDVHWRSVSMNHLRLHPCFDALPERVYNLNTLEDVRKFRQDSWQWDALHSGRCTTSKAAAALGFLEPQAVSAQLIPPSWQHGGMVAYNFLRGRALETIEEMRRVLLEDDTDTSARSNASGASSKPVWTNATAVNSSYPFAAKYLVKMTRAERQRRRKKALSAALNSLSLRMRWGNAQEATAILTALNYFWRFDPNVRIQEIGMCGAGLTQNTSMSTSLLLGASPDALICHSDGTVEVLEVKNHCPFQSTRGRHTKNGGGKDFVVRNLPFREPYIPPLYIPQLMLEMLCVGPHCRSAIMVRQTATMGAMIVRLLRDDAWIEEMIHFLNLFQKEYVLRNEPPPVNFFWEHNTEQSRYLAFVWRTKELSETVRVLDHVVHQDIQRMAGSSTNVTTLFLD